MHPTFLFFSDLSPYFLLIHPLTNKQLHTHTHTHTHAHTHTHTNTHAHSWPQPHPIYRNQLPKCPSVESSSHPSSVLHLEWQVFPGLTKTLLEAPCLSLSRAAHPPL